MMIYMLRGGRTDYTDDLWMVPDVSLHICSDRPSVSI